MVTETDTVVRSSPAYRPATWTGTTEAIEHCTGTEGVLHLEHAFDITAAVTAICASIGTAVRTATSVSHHRDPPPCAHASLTPPLRRCEETVVDRVFDCSRYERLAYLPRGFGRFVTAAHDACVSLVGLEAAIAQTPNPTHPRGDVAALAALGLTWPEERQRLRHALENVVHAVKGDAGRHLQRLQRYLAHLDAKTLSEEDAAAMFDALHLPPDSDAEGVGCTTPVALQRAAELRSCLDSISIDPVPPPAGVVASKPRISRCATFRALFVTAIASSVTAGLATLAMFRALKPSLCAAPPTLLLAVGRAAHSLVLYWAQRWIEGYVAAPAALPKDEQEDTIGAPARELAARLGALRRAAAAVSDERCPRSGDSAIALTEPSEARGAIATAAASLQSLLVKI